MGFNEVLNKLKSRREAEKEYSKQFHIKEKIERRFNERQLSADERELLRNLKEERNNLIKEQAEIDRKARMRKMEWLSNPANVIHLSNSESILDAPHITNSNHSLFNRR